MKISKKVVIGAVATLALPFIVALFLPRTWQAKSNIVINKPLHEVFEYLEHFENQNRWSQWAVMDPDMKVDCRGPDATVGSVYAWDSSDHNVGSGEEEIKEIKPDQRIDYEFRFSRPFKWSAPAHTTFEATPDNQTKVTWYFEPTLPYPMNLIGLISVDKINHDMALSLANLKSQMEGGQQ